ncbi:MAG: hypothetical protein ACT4QE_24840 [Anaerolineales bacterium]
MPRNFWFSLLFIGLSVAAFGAVRTALPAQASVPAAQPRVGPASGAAEVWKLGLTVDGSANYANAAGRLASPLAAFRSNAAVTDVYFAFPPPATAKTVQSAQMLIAQRTGSYSGNATLNLQVFTLSGTLQRTVSAASVDLESATAGSWITLSLSGTPANLQIGSGEYLAFRMTLSGSAGDDLDVRPMFEVVVQ